MDFTNLLKGVEHCVCGKTHTCDLKYIRIRSGALEDLPELTASYSHILLVADQNTFATCGERVVSLLGSRLENRIVFQCEGFLIPNEESIAKIEACVTGQTDLLVGIGSGVINDLCKYVSFGRKLPYYIIGTAPSMDGYASVGAAMITNQMKVTYPTHVPTAIIGDVDILKNAPMRMIQSGFGDIIGKFSSLNDWKLAQLVNGESGCDMVYQMIYDTVLRTQELAGGIQTRDPEAIQNLMEALVLVGIAMSYTGNSRPASGSEHHLSHYFEITGILKKEPYFLHGIDVAYATIETEKLRERLLELRQFPDTVCPHNRALWEKHIRSSYASAADGVIALQDRCGFYDRDYASVYREHWDEIRALLAEVPSSEKIRATLRTAGLDDAEFEQMYGREKIQDCIWYAKDLKDRYTVLWLYYLAFYEEKDA